MGRKSTNKVRSSNEAKRRRFVRSLYPFFKQHGLIGFSMEEVAESLGVSKATIYNYFTSKGEIIDSFLEEKSRDLKGFEKQVTNKQLPVDQRYESALLNLMTHFADFSPKVRHDLEFIFPERWGLFSETLDDYMEIVRSLYREGQKSGVFHAVNPELMSICDKNMILFLSDQQQVARNGFTQNRAFDEFMYMRKNGLMR